MAFGLGLDDVGGNAASTDRANELDAYGRVKSIGTQQDQAGASDSGAAARYYQSLLSGNPAAISAATQPIANATAQQTQQQRQAIVANGGARTGGTNAATQTLDGSADANTSDAVAKVQNGAAAPLATMGSDATGKGLQAADSLGNMANKNRTQSNDISQQQSKEFGDAVSTFLLGM